MPGIRKVNIILSRLCNSSHQGHTTAKTASIIEGQEPAGTVLPAAGIHNLDYVNCAPAVGCEGPAFEPPGDVAVDKQPPSGTSGLQARRGAAHFALARRKGSASSCPTPAVVSGDKPTETTAPAPLLVGK